MSATLSLADLEDAMTTITSHPPQTGPVLIIPKELESTAAALMYGTVTTVGSSSTTVHTRFRQTGHTTALPPPAPNRHERRRHAALVRRAMKKGRR